MNDDFDASETGHDMLPLFLEFLATRMSAAEIAALTDAFLIWFDQNMEPNE